MKTIPIVTFVLFAQLTIFAADTLNTKITQATVFLSGAQIFRETKQVYIPRGIQKYVLKNVSPYLNVNSIQATGEGEYLILDVQHKIRYFEPAKEKPVIIPFRIQKEINQLEDSLLVLKLQVERVNQKLVHLGNEKEMIIKNKLMTGGGRSDSLPVLKDAMKFYRLKLDEIENLIYKEKLKQYKLITLQSKKQTRLKELKQYNYRVKQPVKQKKDEHDIVVTTYSETDTRGKIRVNYMVANAGWIPAYDLRAYDTDEPMLITYKAYVYQNSGEAWDNVKLVLSTYNRSIFTSKPELGIWRLDYYVPLAQKNVYRSQNFASSVQMQTFIDEAEIKAEQLQEKKYISYEEISETSKSFSNIEFEIKLPYSVPSDGEHILMVINNHKVPAEFFHSMVPRISNNGYVMTRIDDWESLNFLSGKANIYFRNTYVGQTAIDPAILQDTMELAIGLDQQVISTRKKLKDETKNVILGKRIQRTFTFEILIRNNSASPITMDVEGQIPVSANDDIKVKLIDPGLGEYTEQTGKLLWNLKLKPGEVKKIKFSYSVEHDKNRQIS